MKVFAIMATEQWKPIQGYECCYEISTEGRVRSLKRQGSKNEFLKHSISGYGYPTVLLRCNGKKIQKAIHRLIAEHYIPNPLNLEMVNHKDNNPANFRIDNLEWVTRGQNIAHGYLVKGRSRKGWRLSTLQYLQKIHNFATVDDMLKFLEENPIQKLKKLTA